MNHLEAAKDIEDQRDAIQEANPQCVDCLAELHSGAVDNYWVSLNLGAVLCKECSGIHRSLGSTVSKVRSLLLDNLSKEQLSILSLLGNARVNSSWEGDRAGADAHRAFSATFASEKYVDHKFAIEKPNPLHFIEELEQAASKLDLVEMASLLSQPMVLSALMMGKSLAVHNVILR